ncbi:MAG: T9SS type A sorting domain-containing protein, partial [Balneolaceae bacterium]
AVNEGGEGDWSNPFSFTTEEEIPDAPDQVVLSSPANGADDISLQPVLGWDVASGAENYELMLSENEDFSAPVIDEAGITGTEFTVTEDLDFNTEYFWRVRAVNEGGEGDWSNPFSFTTEEEIPDAPGQVVLSSPENGAENVPIQPVLEWNSASQADSYEVVVSTNPDFNGGEDIGETGITGTEFEIMEALVIETGYFWRVRAMNDGGEGDWSEVWSFRTEAIAAPANLVLSESGEGEGLVLSWDQPEGAGVTGFRIYRGASARQLDLLESVDGGTFRFTEAAPRQGASFYSVTALNGEEESDFSNLASYYNNLETVPEQWTLGSIPLAGGQIELGSSQVFAFEGAYRDVSALAPARGYWIKSSRGDSYQARGAGLQQAVLNLQKGWNLVGALADSFPMAGIVDSSEILTDTPVFGYNGQEYQQADTLLAGRGYWIYASEEGQVHLDLRNRRENGQAPEKSVNEPVEGLAEISFSTGQAEQVVRVAAMPLDQGEKNRYLLPPRPPDPFLDVRTGDGFAITDRPSTAIELSASHYPVQVELNGIGEDAGYVYRIIAGEGDRQRFIDLLPGRARTIDREYEQLTLTRIGAEEVILATAIDPNYPNPFNPVTTIEYRLTEFTRVRLQVFDLLGRRVATLIDEGQPPGIHRVQFDGSDKASGLYLLRIQAGDYTNVQKLTLIK